MDIQNLITESYQWIKNLTDGEATFYALFVTGVCVSLGWIINKFSKVNPKKEKYIKFKANKGSLVAEKIKNSNIQINHQNIKIKKVKASKGGIATGVDNSKSAKKKKAIKNGK